MPKKHWTKKELERFARDAIEITVASKPVQDAHEDRKHAIPYPCDACPDGKSCAIPENERSDCEKFITRLSDNARHYKTREIDVYEKRGLRHFINPDDPVEADPISHFVDFVGLSEDRNYIVFCINNTIPADMLCSALKIKLNELKNKGIYRPIKRHSDKWKVYVRAYYLSEKKGFTQEDIAKLLHIKKSTVGYGIRQMRDFFTINEMSSTPYLPCERCPHEGKCSFDIYENCEKLKKWNPDKPLKEKFHEEMPEEEDD